MNKIASQNLIFREKQNNNNYQSRKDYKFNKSFSYKSNITINNGKTNLVCDPKPKFFEDNKNISTKKKETAERFNKHFSNDYYNHQHPHHHKYNSDDIGSNSPINGDIIDVLDKIGNKDYLSFQSIQNKGSLKNQFKEDYLSNSELRNEIVKSYDIPEENYINNNSKSKNSYCYHITRLKFNRNSKNSKSLPYFNQANEKQASLKNSKNIENSKISLNSKGIKITKRFISPKAKQKANKFELINKVDHSLCLKSLNNNIELNQIGHKKSKSNKLVDLKPKKHIIFNHHLRKYFVSSVLNLSEISKLNDYSQGIIKNKEVFFNESSIK